MQLASLALALAPLVAAAPQGGATTPTAAQTPAASPDLPAWARASARSACAWLVAQQQDDGSWAPDGQPVPVGAGAGQVSDDEFWDDVLGGADPEAVGEKPAQRGLPIHRVGVTALALQALRAEGHTATRGEHAAAVAKGLRWLLARQDAETGLIGDRVGHAFLYDHAIATLALCEHMVADPESVPHDRAQAAVNFIARARNPYRVWRYDVPPTGDNDTSITTWMTLANLAAEDAGLKIDAQAGQAVLAWLDEMTDEGTGRVGYTETGSRSSRVPGQNVQFDAAEAETLTSEGLLCRLLLGQEPRNPMVVAHVKCMLRATAEPSAGAVRDAMWIHFGTRSLSIVGSRPWSRWSERVLPAVLDAQSTEGPLAGSWEPTTAWSFATGRIGTTALLSVAASTTARRGEVSAPARRR